MRTSTVRPALAAAVAALAVFADAPPLDAQYFGRNHPHPAERGFLSSAGAGARVNLFGYAIAEVSYARALAGDFVWEWQFALQPGF